MKKTKSLAQFFKIQNQLEALHGEISILSKRKPDDAVNTFKLNYINQVLSEANSILDENYIPLNGFNTFDLDNLPTNSDVVVILSQYIKCFHRQYADM
ncbi:MAG: hypothetical protein WAW61_21790 [Methylococcaceae bacterium]